MRGCRRNHPGRDRLRIDAVASLGNRGAQREQPAFRTSFASEANLGARVYGWIGAHQKGHATKFGN